MTDRERKIRESVLATITGTGATAGGVIGLQGLKLVPRSVKKRILDKLIADHPIIITTLMAPELVTGSGEAKMARNITELLRANGIDARLGFSGGGEHIPDVLSNGFFKAWKPYDIPAYRDTFREGALPWYIPTQVQAPGSAIDHKNLAALRELAAPGGGNAGDMLLEKLISFSGKDGAEWLSRVDNATKERIFTDLLSGKSTGIGIPEFDKAWSKIRAGNWDGISPGRLTTILKLTNNLDPINKDITKDGSRIYITPGEVRRRIESGRAAGILATERGFDWVSPSRFNERMIRTEIAKQINKSGLPKGIKDSIVTKLTTGGYINEEQAKMLEKHLGKETINELNRFALDSRARESLENTLSEHIGPNKGVKNLGLLYNFKANYSNPKDSWIPGAKVSMPDSNIADYMAKRTSARDKLFGRINEMRAAEGLAPLNNNSKVIFMSGGSIGPNGTQKLIDVLEATKDMPDVHVFSQIGGNQEFLDMVQNNAAYRKRISGMTTEQIKKYNRELQNQGNMIRDISREYAGLANKYPGKFTITSRLPSNMLTNSINGADLYIPYGGSSTAQEATGFLTPQAFSTDDKLNIGNVDYVVGKRNSPLMTKLDNTSTALRRFIETDPKANNLYKSNDFNGLKNYLAQTYRMGLSPEKIPGIADITDSANKASKFNADTIKRLLSDDTRAKAFSQENLNRVINLVKSEHEASSRLVSIAKQVAKDAVNRTDEGLRYSFSPRGILNGLKGSYLRFGRALAKGPVNSRLAPLFIGTGVLGGGIGAYALGKNMINRS